MDRREAIKVLTFGTVGGGLLLSGCESPSPGQKEELQTKFWDHVTKEDLEMWNARFFTDHEYETVRQLANIIIPADDRSGNAEDAGVPEFIDFMMFDRPEYQTPIRGGLRWLDLQCQKFFNNKNFIDCSKKQKKQMLDKIAYPDAAEPDMEPGVNFFNRFRDLVSSGFWSSKIGIEDIQYLGNQPWDWQGCPHDALEHVGLAKDTKSKSA